MRAILWLILSFPFMPALHAQAILHDLRGNSIPFVSLQGKWVFINYWASWCRMCLDEISELNAFYEENKTQNVALFAVNYDRLPTAQQAQLIQKLGIRYPSLQQDPATLLQLGDIVGLPVTFVFNPEGQLHQTLYGEQTVKSLTRTMSP